MTTLTSSRPTRSPRPTRARRRLVLVLLTVLVLVALAIPLGLKTIHDQSTSSGSTAGSAQPASGEYGVAPKAPSAARDSAGQGPADVTGGAPASSVGGSSGASGSTANGASPSGTTADLIEPKIVRSAWLGVHVGDLTTTTAKARLIATSAGGRVTSENVVTATDPTGGYGKPAAGSTTAPGYANPNDTGDVYYPPVGVDEARMTLSVPEDKLDGVLIELSRLGTVAYRSSQSTDVTDTYVDTKARIAPAQESIDQIRRLLTQAKDLQQIILLEQELNRRQADLDSLTQQLAQLERSTTMSDVTLTMWTDQTAPATTGNGFVDGLRTAWQGLLTSVSVILNGLAALLPWLLVVGLLAWAGLRIYRRRTGVVSTTTPPAGAEPAAVAAPATVGAAQPSGATPATPATPAPPASGGPSEPDGGATP